MLIVKSRMSSAAGNLLYLLFSQKQSYYRQKTSPFTSQRTHTATNKTVSYYEATDKSISPSLPPSFPSYAPFSLPHLCHFHVKDTSLRILYSTISVFLDKLSAWHVYLIVQSCDLSSL